MMPASRANFCPPCAVAPHTQTRISLEAFPPSMGRLLIRLTVRPSRAAAIAAQVPASPPPITVMSAVVDTERMWSSRCRYFDLPSC